MKGTQLTSKSNPKRVRNRISWVLSLGVSLTGLLLMPPAATAKPEDLEWARVDFLSNRVQLVPREQRSRHARIADVLSIGDALRTARASRAELRFNDGSLARIGERATFRFTPNTRNFQLSNGTVLLLIPPGRGRSTIQTPNAVTGIQGSALFVRYIPETDTTIVGALTDNPNGPMILFNEAGTERQALRSNEIGVIEGDQITQIYQFDGALFWQSSGLAEGFDYLSPPSGTGDPLDGVRQEIQEALSNQRPLNGDGVIENPDSFSRPAPPVEEVPEPAINEPVADSQEPATTAAINDSLETDTASEGISDTEPAIEPTIDDVTATEAPTASEELDLEVALDLELELDLEADGVEAPDLDINETVQQYLEGDISDLNGSADLEAENSLEVINADEGNVGEGGETEGSSPEVSSGNDTVNEDEPASASETPDEAPEVSEDQTVTNSSTAVDDSSNSDGSNLVDDVNSEPNGSDLDSSSSESVPSATAPSSAVDSSLSLDQTSGPVADQSTFNDATGTELPTDAPSESELPVSADPTVSTSSAVTAAPDVPELQTNLSSTMSLQVDQPTSTAPEIAPTAVPTDVSPSDVSPSEMSGNLAEETAPVVSAEINVIDLSPAVDEPPVEVFSPADKVDDVIMMHDMEGDMDHDMDPEDDMSGDMNSPQP